MIGSLIKAAINVVVLPVEVVKDVVTMGGSLDGENETYTGKRIKKVVEKLDEAAK